MEQLLASPASSAVIMSRKSWAVLGPQAHPSWRIVLAHRVAKNEMLVLGGGGA